MKNKVEIDTDEFVVKIMELLSKGEKKKLLNR